MGGGKEFYSLFAVFVLSVGLNPQLTTTVKAQTRLKSWASFFFLSFFSFFFRQKWDPNDDRMVECDACKLWVHDKCDKAAGPVLENPKVRETSFSL